MNKAKNTAPPSLKKSQDDVKAANVYRRYYQQQNAIKFNMNCIPPLTRLLCQSLATTTGVPPDWFLPVFLHLTSFCAWRTMVVETHSYFKPVIAWYHVF